MALNSKGKSWDSCDELGIHGQFSTPYFPQANEQIDIVIKMLNNILKMKLDTAKGLWIHELPQIYGRTAPPLKQPHEKILLLSLCD